MFTAFVRRVFDTVHNKQFTVGILIYPDKIISLLLFITLYVYIELFLFIFGISRTSFDNHHLSADTILGRCNCLWLFISLQFIFWILCVLFLSTLFASERATINTWVNQLKNLWVCCNVDWLYLHITFTECKRFLGAFWNRPTWLKWWWKNHSIMSLVKHF